MKQKKEIHKHFKVNQDAVLIGPSGHMLILKQPEGWQLPGGHMEDDDTTREGLMREFFEETGMKEKDIEIKKILATDLSVSKKTYRVTFLCYTKTEDVRLSHEHIEYKWVDIKDAINYNFKHKGTVKIISDMK